MCVRGSVCVCGVYLSTTRCPPGTGGTSYWCVNVTYSETLPQGGVFLFTRRGERVGRVTRPSSPTLRVQSRVPRVPVDEDPGPI